MKVIAPQGSLREPVDRSEQFLESLVRRVLSLRHPILDLPQDSALVLELLRIGYQECESFLKFLPRQIVFAFFRWPLRLLALLKESDFGVSFVQNVVGMLGDQLAEAISVKPVTGCNLSEQLVQGQLL